mmetsp:Transcript_39998/g.103301  ORF Transcript_39998/g.103301 Transcript_39998/m.103301 type:complete len:315 (-) Transcript_39998:145-1089(-)
MPSFRNVAEYREAQRQGKHFNPMANGRTTRYFTETLMCMISNSNTSVNPDGTFRFNLPTGEAGFIKNLRILQARFPNTFTVMPQSELTVKFYNGDTYRNFIKIVVPACGATASSMASFVNAYQVTDSADTDYSDLADADMKDLPLSLNFRGIDQKFYFTFNTEEMSSPNMDRAVITGSLLGHLGFTTDTIEISNPDVSDSPSNVYASLFPKLWGEQQQIYIRIPNLKQRNHKMWDGKRVYEDLYNVSAIGTYGQETVFEYDRDRTHMHSVAWYGNDQARISEIDIKLTDDSDKELDFQGQNWYILIEIEYNVAN